IPPAFLKNFNGVFPKICILKSISEKSWQVTMDKNDEGYFFSNGWSEFVKYHNLEFGDFVLFWFLGDSKFEVVIYGRTACEKDIDFKCEECPTKRKSNASRKYLNLSFLFGVEFLEMTIDMFGSCKVQGKHKVLTKKLEVKKKKKRVLELIVSYQLIHPVKILQDYQKFNIVIPITFARVTGFMNKKKAMVKDPQGNVWPVEIHIVKSGHVHLSTGWSKFWAAKGLAAGDTCLFQYIQGTGNVLFVKILSKGAGSSEDEAIKEEPIEFN
ncbi:LOW QUALITY PROTEIN: B3 domain-containing protein, partial [Cephalotus follicularis]